MSRCILRLKEHIETATYTLPASETVRREPNPARSKAKAFADTLAAEHGMEAALDSLDGARIHLASAISTKAVSGPANDQRAKFARADLALRMKMGGGE